MGGQAFASGPEPLYTPRMPSAFYRHVRDHCHRVLRQIFICVATPIEAPSKKDYGDIDIFLAWERSKTFPSNTTSESLQGLPKDPLEAAAHLLDARKTLKGEPGSLMLAIPWPEELDSGEDGESAEPRFIQVDLHYYKSLDTLQWMLFKHAHGDLWNILGATIRPFGLTIDHIGLYLRIPEIEDNDRKKAKIFLSQDPAIVLDFLGLECDGTKWEVPFSTFDDVFEYAATSRFFWVRPKDEDSPEHEKQTGGQTERDKLKSNDRRRMNQRILFREWVDEFIPRCREQGRFMEPRMARSEVRDEAFARFPGVKGDYSTRLLEWRIQRQKESLWKNVIKASLPEASLKEGSGGPSPMWRSCAASAFKKIIMQGDTSFSILPPGNFKDVHGLYIENDVRNFVRETWKKVGDEAWRQNQQRYREHVEKTGKKRTVSGGEEVAGKRTNAGPSDTVNDKEGGNALVGGKDSELS